MSVRLVLGGAAMTGAKAVAMALVLAAATSCRRAPKSGWVVVELPGESGDEAPSIAPRDAVRSVAREGGRIIVEVDPSRAAGGVTLSFARRCEVRANVRAAETVHTSAAPWLDVGGPLTELGFDAPFELRATAGCEAARRGRIAWRQLEGAPLGALASSDDGFRLSARTAPAALGAVPAWGIVPVSPATRGEAVLEATWEGAGHEPLRATVRVSAIARARGLPNVPVDATVLLAGAGWRVAKAPAAAHAALATHGGTASLRPDVPGSYELVDGAGRTLALRAGRYDETRLDCGRSECHAGITRAASAMHLSSEGAALRPAGEAVGPLALTVADDPTCALGCHATGEPGLHDGGFGDVARSFGAGVVRAGASDDLPRALHRLGGVGCMACHGPGAIPEPAARAAIVRVGVCAFCHDAPPRYGHVAAWRASAMARSDTDPRTRAEPSCARCHTTAGFLRAVAPGSADRASDEPAGIACAACHAVHGDVEEGGALLRRVPWPSSLDAVPANARAKSAACVACHAPDERARTPVASAAAIWAGAFGLDTMTGAPLPRVAPHASLDGGCVACHRDGSAALERGAGHTFRAGAASCPRCHGAESTPVAKRSTPVDLRPRALDLYRRALARLGLPPNAADAPPHASAPALDLATPVGRAAYDAALVLEDPAAAAHNPTYARTLLDQAERALGAPRE